MTTHSSTLAWKIPWTEEPGRLHSMGSQGWTQLSTSHTHTHTHTVVSREEEKRLIINQDGHPASPAQALHTTQEGDSDGSILDPRSPLW